MLSCQGTPSSIWCNTLAWLLADFFYLLDRPSQRSSDHYTPLQDITKHSNENGAHKLSFSKTWSLESNEERKKRGGAATQGLYSCSKVILPFCLFSCGMLLMVVAWMISTTIWYLQKDKMTCIYPVLLLFLCRRGWPNTFGNIVHVEI